MYGEYDHGFDGIIQSYKDLFESTSDIVVLKLLRILAEGNYRGHLPCPCDSGQRLRNCHGLILLEVSKGTNRESFLYDFLQYLFFKYESVEKIPPGMISKRIQKYLKKVLKATEKMGK
ncbi:SEC-C metal-binding domain-containing protein [Desulfosarcina widdelii]|uniref:SEC-C metal-binding domain-containing protein n=1 Tax=Desulfosarcina widdelii TaxID=947919 RepID=UPI0012D30864